MRGKTKWGWVMMNQITPHHFCKQPALSDFFDEIADQARRLKDSSFELESAAQADDYFNLSH